MLILIKEDAMDPVSNTGYVANQVAEVMDASASRKEEPRPEPGPQEGVAVEKAGPPPGDKGGTVDQTV